MRPKSDTLTGQELEIMKVIWPLGRATVREVYDELANAAPSPTPPCRR